MPYFGLVDISVLIGLLLSSLFIGFFFAWRDRNRTTEEFLNGGKTMKTLPVAFSLVVSYVSALTMIGWPVEVYTKGLQVSTSLLVAFPATYIAAETFIPVFHKLGIISVNTYLDKRFQSKLLTKATSALTTFSWLPYLGIVLYTPALSLGVIGQMSVPTSILITGIVVMVYSSLGGLKAVVWTDVLQGMLMLAAMVAILVKMIPKVIRVELVKHVPQLLTNGLTKDRFFCPTQIPATLFEVGTMTVGSVKEVYNRCKDGGRVEFFNSDFNLNMSNNLWTVISGNFFMWLAGTSIDQLLVQRSCCLPTIKKAKSAIYMATAGLVILDVCVVYFGMVMYANYYKCDPIASGKAENADQIVTIFVGEMFSGSYPGMTGIFVAGLFSSSLSTLSSAYNALSALVWEDWLKPSLPPLKRTTALLVTKMVGFSIGLVTIAAAFLVMNIGTVFEAAFLLSAVPYGPVYGVFFLGMFLSFVNTKGSLCGLISGQLVGLWIVVGSLTNKVDPNVQLTLDTSTEECISPANFSKSVPFSTLKYLRIPDYNPTGLDKIYHLSPLVVPILTFVVTIFVGIFISLITGGNKDTKINPELMVDFNFLRLPSLRTKKFDLTKSKVQGFISGDGHTKKNSISNKNPA